MSIYHDRIITPDTDPDRFTEQEADAFRRGVCAQTGRGYWGGEICGVQSEPGASFGNCALHNVEMLVDCWPDGSPREDYGSADRARREEEALAAHQKACGDPDCECRLPAGGGR
jgi:hypothetical protein